MPIITLITDYGTRDPYVGAVKGVLLTLAPKATIVDVTHEIEPFNVTHGAFVLRQVLPWFPPTSVHLAVVDPGVGSDRRILMGQYAGQWVVAPDNGLLTFLHRDLAIESLRVVEERTFFHPSISSTFHGRDIMAPVAAHLANGVRPRVFGRTTDRLELLPVAHRAEVVGHSLRGSVLYVDRFGTMITNVRQEQLSAPRVHDREWEVRVNGAALGPIRKSFYEGPRGQPIAVLGSSGAVEIAVNQGRAVDHFGRPEEIHVEVF